MLSARETVELFHLQFLDQFGRKTDKNLYALKGGCNLRFFLKSVRYSEDIDLDVHTIGKETLYNKVDKILKSDPLHLVLKSRGLTISEISAPKQTETVQRWKLSVINLEGGGLPARTKIEFSRRRFDEGVKFESIDPALVSHYRIYPVLVNHYSPETAYKQKVEALISRAETQARDLFDLDLLLKSGVNSRILLPRLANQADQAIETAYSVKFEDFKGQVWAYLGPEYQRQFDSSDVWDEMVLRVVEALKGKKQ